MPEVRPIDANALLKKGKCSPYIDNFIPFNAVKNAPTLDFEPVVHAHWIENCDGAELQLVCNQCGYDYIEADSDCTERHNFCPHCGAKMDEEVKG